MSPEKMRNLITMMETGVTRLKEAESDLAVLQVLRTMAAVCNHQAVQVEREFNAKIDRAIEHNNLVEAGKAEV